MLSPHHLNYNSFFSTFISLTNENFSALLFLVIHVFFNVPTSGSALQYSQKFPGGCKLCLVRLHQPTGKMSLESNGHQ